MRIARIEGNALLQSKRAFPYVEKSLSLYQRDAPFICNQQYSRPSPFGEGTGVRLLLSLRIGLEKAFLGVRIGFNEGYP